jgi:hypothetical protein
MRHLVDVAVPKPAYVMASSSQLLSLTGGAHDVLVDRLVHNVPSMDTYLKHAGVSYIHVVVQSLCRYQ